MRHRNVVRIAVKNNHRAPQTKTPGSFLPGVLLDESQTIGSEVTLNANVEATRVLVLELVEPRSASEPRGQGSRTSELLVEVEPHGLRPRTSGS